MGRIERLKRIKWNLWMAEREKIERKIMKENLFHIPEGHHFICTRIQDNSVHILTASLCIEMVSAVADDAVTVSFHSTWQVMTLVS